MKFALRNQDKRALIALAVALGAYLAVSRLALPAYDHLRAGAETVTDKEEELRKYRRALVSRERYTQLLEQAKKSVAEAEGRLVRGDNPSLAQVELQTIVEDAAKKVNIPLGQRSVSAAKKKDAYFNEITMTISFESTLNQASSFLAEMRTSPKYVTVRSLQLAPVQSAQEAPTKGELKKTVKVNLTISAPLMNPPIAGKG